MILIDGSEGEGGGQILRTSLSLSALTGQPFRMENIRAGRQKPGLLRQHLTALQATATLCGGKHSDDTGIGAATLEFYPGTLRPGTYEFAVGTAGSAMLVLQTRSAAAPESGRTVARHHQRRHPQSGVAAVRVRGGRLSAVAAPYGCRCRCGDHRLWVHAGGRRTDHRRHSADASARTDRACRAWCADRGGDRRCLLCQSSGRCRRARTGPASANA